MSGLTEEPFDRVYFYGPYTGVDQIVSVHGVSGLCASGIDLFIQDQASLVVLVREGRIVTYAEIPTDVALFDPELSQGVDREGAVLGVRMGTLVGDISKSRVNLGDLQVRIVYLARDR